MGYIFEQRTNPETRIGKVLAHLLCDPSGVPLFSEAPVAFYDLLGEPKANSGLVIQGNSAKIIRLLLTHNNELAKAEHQTDRTLQDLTDQFKKAYMLPEVWKHEGVRKLLVHEALQGLIVSNYQPFEQSRRLGQEGDNWGCHSLKVDVGYWFPDHLKGLAQQWLDLRKTKTHRPEMLKLEALVGFPKEGANEPV
jgi:hypothetical protein